MTQDTHPSLRGRTLTGHQPLLAALITVLAWNVIALAAWLAYAVASTRQDPDWGDLVMIVVAMMGVGAFFVSLLIGGVVVAVMNRRGRWRDTGVSTDRAIGRGTVAAAAGLGPFLVYVVVAVVTSALSV